MAEKKRFALIFAGIILAFAIICPFFIKNPNITGFVVYGNSSDVKTWNFDNPEDYAYNHSLIEIADGEVKLLPATTRNYWNTATETDYYVTAALYNPPDKTDKIKAMDNKYQVVTGNNIFDIFFNEELNNGDMISLYIKSGVETNIYLCEKGTLCDAGYGLVYYLGGEGWYNITISDLDSPANVVSLVSQDNFKVNYITSSKGDAIKGLFEPHDQTSKILFIDNDVSEIKKTNIFNIIFDNKISNGDIVSLYLTDCEGDDIFLCDYGDVCSSPGYGSVVCNGAEGWYNITVNGLSTPTDAFNLEPVHIEIDYIKAVHIEDEEHNSSDLIYPTNAEIETDDFEIEDLAEFGSFGKEESLNGQPITYYYSVDSGLSWGNIPESGNLAEVNAANKKIRVKAVLNSNESNTPILKQMNLGYSVRQIICSEDWIPAYGECLVNDTQLKSYIDKNNCETSEGLPADNGTYVNCDFCIPNWMPLNASCSPSDTLVQSFNDSNNCYAKTGLLSDNNPPANQTLNCDFCTPNWIEINSSCQPNDVLTSWYNDINSCYSKTNLEPDNNPPSNNTYPCDYCAPNTINTSWTEWQNQDSCLANDTWLQNRSKAEYDYNYNTCYAVTNLESDLWNNGLNKTHIDYRFVACDYCTPNWIETNSTCQPNDIIIAEYTDSNDCYAKTGLDSDQSTFNKTYPCDYVISTEFDGSSTDFSSVDLSNITHPVLEVLKYGKINFSEPVIFNKSIDLDSNIEISSNLIFVNSSALPELNKSAVLSLYNLNFTNPIILQDGGDCPSSICTNAAYANGTLVFNVTHFTVFSASEGPYCGDALCNDGETCSTCTADCRACPSPESSSSESSGSGGSSSGGGSRGGGSSSWVTPVVGKEIDQKETKKPESVKQEVELASQEEAVCDNAIDVSSDKASFIEGDSLNIGISNKGNCDIGSLHLSLSPNLKEIVTFSSPDINLKKGESIDVLLIKKEAKQENLVTGAVTTVNKFNRKIADAAIKTSNGNELITGAVARASQYNQKITNAVVKASGNNLLTGAITKTSKYNKIITGTLILEGVANQEPVLIKEAPLTVEMPAEKAEINAKRVISICLVAFLAIFSLVVFKNKYKKTNK